MGDQVQHQPARLIEVELGDGERVTTPKTGGRDVAVQFNPESLKVTRANAVAKTETAGSSAMQFVATTSTKLDLELWFGERMVMPTEPRASLPSGAGFDLPARTRVPQGPKVLTCLGVGKESTDPLGRDREPSHPCRVGGG